MHDQLIFSIIMGVFGFVCGLIMRGGANYKQLRGEYMRGMADGILEVSQHVRTEIKKGMEKASNLKVIK